MMTDDLLFDKYRRTGNLSGEELLLCHADALRFVADCEDLGLTILGMDFYAGEGGHPVEVGSADWSSLVGGPDSAERSIRETRALIGEGLPDGAHLVSFVVDDRGSTASPRRF